MRCADETCGSSEGREDPHMASWRRCIRLEFEGRVMWEELRKNCEISKATLFSRVIL